MQTILTGIGELELALRRFGVKKAFLVCDPAFDLLPIRDCVLEACRPPFRFKGFTPNPKYEEAEIGANLFRGSGCNGIVAVGGGSALDVAKCVRAFAGMDPAKNYLEQPYPENGAPLIAIPTTAGTGSESTQYVALYRDGEKQSLAYERLLPDCAILEPDVLKTLPGYQRKCTMLDALCHAVESWWSIPSTPESQALSRRALTGIMRHMEAYLANTPEGNRGMQMAANLAGQAINLSPTTAAHAMSYKLTTLYGLPHGLAAGLCLPHLWEYMIGHIAACRDPRGGAALMETLDDIARALGAEGVRSGARRVYEILDALGLAVPPKATEEEIRSLARSVNPVRLKNFPAPIDEGAAEALYREILNP
jgi:alcohol dehydrogenase class IV